jgi:hypothetical protein
MKPERWWTCLFFSLVVCACSSQMQLMKGTGESVSVRLLTGSEWNAELVSVLDSGLVCVLDVPVAPAGLPDWRGRVVVIPAQVIEDIKVTGVRNPNWPIGILLYQVLPAIGLGIAAASVNGENALPVTSAALVPAALSAIMLSATGLSSPAYRGPLGPRDLADIRRYARFAGTLSEEQMQSLLHTYGQTAVARLPG